MKSNFLPVALAAALACGIAQAQPVNATSNATTTSNSSSQSAGGTGYGGGGGAGYGGSAQGGGGGSATAGGAQVGATTAGNTQNFSPTTNNNYITPDVQTVNQNVNGTQNVNQTTNGHTTTNGTLKTEGTQTNLNLVGGVQGQQVNYGGSYTVKNVPGLGNINLSSSNDTCMGTWSAGLAVPGFGGQVGSTYTDENCIMLKNAREMHNMGMPAAALARLCQNKENREAIRVSWKDDKDYLCPDDVPSRNQARAAGQTGVAYVAPATVVQGSQPGFSNVGGATVAAHGRVVTVAPGWETANLADKAIFDRMMASR